MHILLSVWLASVLIAISINDMRERRIPDWLCLPLISVGLALAALDGIAVFQTHVIGAVAGFASLAIFGEIYFRLRGCEGLGLGDAKLFGAAGAWLGWQPLPHVLLFASATGLVYALARPKEVVQDEQIAFGPFICAGFFLLWYIGTRLTPNF